MTGRKVTVQDVNNIKSCEKIVNTGSTRKEAESMACEISLFPQSTVLTDRRSIIETRRLTVQEGLRSESMNGVDANS